ncbi:hypothetical protein Sp245p_25250 (plasmid) [Azospirillum baldaniorum]|uniref:Uncharacterized protein n=1 Tax=Azospirillum baldaniorum TaxID=1064539 RepID=A0A9P1NQB2_9PROT|nr:hypothetical protein Sp245p_25250 [Azospirillum baldaniorum]CCD01800.1 protein of unknown function [Azospirillum baldaniorum]
MKSNYAGCAINNRWPDLQSSSNCRENSKKCPTLCPANAGFNHLWNPKSKINMGYDQCQLHCQHSSNPNPYTNRNQSLLMLWPIRCLHVHACNHKEK